MFQAAWEYFPLGRWNWLYWSSWRYKKITVLYQEQFVGGQSSTKMHYFWWWSWNYEPNVIISWSKLFVWQERLYWIVLNTVFALGFFAAGNGKGNFNWKRSYQNAYIFRNQTFYQSFNSTRSLWKIWLSAMNIIQLSTCKFVRNQKPRTRTFQETLHWSVGLWRGEVCCWA